MKVRELIAVLQRMPMDNDIIFDDNVDTCEPTGVYGNATKLPLSYVYVRANTCMGTLQQVANKIPVKVKSKRVK